MDKIVIHTDGGCRGNQYDTNIGGWGSVLKYKGVVLEMKGGCKNTTNNIQELKGVIEALKKVATTGVPVEIYSDSRYVVENKNNHVDSWIKRGWRKADKKPVLNLDLWKELVELSDRQKDITYHWIKGHASNEGNIRADKLANEAMDDIEMG